MNRGAIEALRFVYLAMSMGYNRAEAWLRTPGEIMLMWYYHRLFNGKIQRKKQQSMF